MYVCADYRKDWWTSIGIVPSGVTAPPSRGRRWVHSAAVHSAPSASSRSVLFYPRGRQTHGLSSTTSSSQSMHLLGFRPKGIFSFHLGVVQSICLCVLSLVMDVQPGYVSVCTNADMAMGPVFVTQPNPSMKNVPLHAITTVMSHHKILQGPLAANVKSN